jgi:hypothetical protein
METTSNIKFGIGIAFHNLITEDELKPIVSELKEKGIELEYNYFTRGAQASIDWLTPVVALYGDSEMFRSLIQNGAYDALKFYLFTLIKKVASRKYFKLTSQTTEEKQGSFSIVVYTKEKASATYNFEGMLSETDIKNSLDAFVKSVNILQPDSNKQNMIHANFDIKSNEWNITTMNEMFEQTRKLKEHGGNEKFLLYIDILGFSELIKSNDNKVAKLYSIIDTLHVHQHDTFETIVFSDTILVFNKVNPITNHDNEYLVMYFCEFVQDLFYRCIELEIHFRAILTHGEFLFEKMKHISAYYGNALIDSYLKEKDIDAMGMFIDKRLKSINRLYPSISFDSNLDFVYLTQSIERVSVLYNLEFPIDKFIIESTDEYLKFKDDVQYLKSLKVGIDTHTNSKIRSKYLQSYHFYMLRYGKHIKELEKESFNYKILSPDANW